MSVQLLEPLVSIRPVFMVAARTLCQIQDIRAATELRQFNIISGALDLDLHLTQLKRFGGEVRIGLAGQRETRPVPWPCIESPPAPEKKFAFHPVLDDAIEDRLFRLMDEKGMFDHSRALEDSIDLYKRAFDHHVKGYRLYGGVAGETPREISLGLD